MEKDKEASHGDSINANSTARCHRAYLGLGSSLGNRREHLQVALDGLTDREGTVRAVVVSPVYESPHLGLQPGDEQRYPAHLNCVVAVETTLTPAALLQWVQEIEARGHRQRTERWGPRTIDIDLLLYDDLVMQTDELTIPHPGVKQRAFALKPLFDLVPDFVFPDGQPLRELLASETICAQPIERVPIHELFI